MFGLTMYLAGIVAIKVYPKVMPVVDQEGEKDGSS